MGPHWMAMRLKSADTATDRTQAEASGSLPFMHSLGVRLLGVRPGSVKPEPTVQCEPGPAQVLLDSVLPSAMENGRSGVLHIGCGGQI